MKDSCPSLSLVRICRLLGITRQALYQHGWHKDELNVQAEVIIQQVIAIRRRHPVIGTRKLYRMLQPFLQAHRIPMGRDKLFTLLADYKLLVRRRKRRVTTTQSYHRFHKYPNLIRDMKVSGVNQLWVSDITYYKMTGKFVYLSFITDAYSRKIVGYHLAETLDTVHSVSALAMAIRGIDGSGPNNIIHHSDRGIQYCSAKYTRMLEQNGIGISMTENGDPLENSIAERINGIIKNEYLKQYRYNTIAQLDDHLNQVINFYNNERPHSSCSMRTPNEVHQQNLPVQRTWKTYYRSQKPATVT